MTYNSKPIAISAEKIEDHGEVGAVDQQLEISFGSRRDGHIIFTEHGPDSSCSDSDVSAFLSTHPPPASPPSFPSLAPPLLPLPPIFFILIVTAIKDVVEDYRRAKLDEEVNTSAVTRLGQWRNVNQPLDPRPWYERLLRINDPGKVSKGVQKLREKEAGEGMRIVLSKCSDGDRVSMSTMDPNESTGTLSLGRPTGAGGRHLEGIASIDSHAYFPGFTEIGSWGQNTSLLAYQQSIPSRSSFGVIDWKRRTSGTSRWERTL